MMSHESDGGFDTLLEVGFLDFDSMCTKYLAIRLKESLIGHISRHHCN